jgi:hypothetical protein
MYSISGSKPNNFAAVKKGKTKAAPVLISELTGIFRKGELKILALPLKSG